MLSRHCSTCPMCGSLIHVLISIWFNQEDLLWQVAAMLPVIQIIGFPSGSDYRRDIFGHSSSGGKPFGGRVGTVG